MQYFQWRKGRGGSEKFHGAVIDHNGKAEGRVFQDVKNVGISLENLAEIAGSTVKSEIAVVYEFQNRWALENAQGFHNPDKKYKRTCINHYKEFWKRGINVDVIGVDKDFAGYKVLVLPMLYSISEESANRIASYVAGGGTVVATYMTGYVNETDLCHLGGFPGGKLKEVFGLTADEIDTLYPNEKNTVCMGAKRYEVIDYCELVTPNGAEVLGVYAEDFYVGKPAVLENQYGAGKAYYIACRDSGELLDALYEHVIRESGVEKMIIGAWPEGVTMHTRQNEESIYLFFENYSSESRRAKGLGEFVDVESGQSGEGSIEIEGYGIRILKKCMENF